MTHPAFSAVEASKKRRYAGAVEGKRASIGRLDRKKGGAVDVSSWRPPVAHDVQPLNQPPIEDGWNKDRGISDAKGDIPERKQYARGGGIHIKESHKGLLHKDLGVPAGNPISEKKMERAKADAGPAERKRITFAENAKKWHHGG